MKQNVNGFLGFFAEHSLALAILVRFLFTFTLNVKDFIENNCAHNVTSSKLLHSFSDSKLN
jgi:hypothetical protein